MLRGTSGGEHCMAKEFIGYTEGYLTTTDIDAHGDRLTPEAVESFADQLRKDPVKRTLYLQHDTEQPIGYITEFHVETKGEWKGLRAKVGIYATRPDVWEMMQSGKLSGFSFGAKLIEKEVSVMSKKECSFSIEIEGQYWHEFRDMLVQMGAQVEVYVHKAVDYPTIIEVSCSLLSLAGTIYGVYFLARRKHSEPTIRIARTQRRLNFKDRTVEEIIEEIEVTSKEGKK